MKAQIKLFFLALLLFSFQTPETLEGKVIGVSDGDTIRLLVNNEQIKIRLYGIDCPEKSQAFGTKAKQYTSDECFSKSVKIICHGKDKYGRTLGDVILPDGSNLNEKLVKNGFAWHYKKYCYCENLMELEKEAKTNKRGLWIDPAPMTPWDFRKLNK